jgi:hypothetical protein
MKRADAHGQSRSGDGPMYREATRVLATVLVFCIGVISSTVTAEEVKKDTSYKLDASQLTYTRLYCTPDNESHFAEVTAELTKQNFAPPAAPIYIGDSQPASSVFFAGFEARWGAPDLVNHLYHPTPAVQLLTVAEGVFSITTTDGETRQLHAGDVVHLEDVRPAEGTLQWSATRPDSWYLLANAASRARPTGPLPTMCGHGPAAQRNARGRRASEGRGGESCSQLLSPISESRRRCRLSETRDVNVSADALLRSAVSGADLSRPSDGFGPLRSSSKLFAFADLATQSKRPLLRSLSRRPQTMRRSSRSSR